MPKPIRLCAAALLSLLGGCATQASREVDRISQGSADFAREIFACYARAEATPEYREVGALLPPLDGRQQAPMSLLANQQRPTVEQAAALQRLYNQSLQPCYDTGAAQVAALDPPSGAIVRQSVSLGATGYARLASRQITWGQYAQFQNQLRAETTTALAQQAQRVADRLQAQHAQEVQARGDAFAEASATMYQWQMVTAANEPRSTTCRVVGSYLNCTTY